MKNVSHVVGAHEKVMTADVWENKLILKDEWQNPSLGEK